MHNSRSTRRNFIGVATGAAAAVALNGNPSTTLAKEKRNVFAGKPIMVHHEWGTLKEVVVGVPNIRLPSKLAEAPKRFLPDASVEFIEKNAGKKLEECAPDLNEQFVRQVDGIIKTLRGGDCRPSSQETYPKRRSVLGGNE